MNGARLLTICILIGSIGLVVSENNFTFVRSRYRDRQRSSTAENTAATTLNSKIDDDTDESKAAKVGATAETQDLKLICGAQTAENHPWIAVLEHTDPNKPKSKKKTLSKGVLISSQHVLTTVSSIHNSHPFWVVSGVRLGDTPTWATEGMARRSDQVVHRGIDEVYIHENKDIAVIKLDEKVDFSDAIRPVCLLSQGEVKHIELYLHQCKRIKHIPLREAARVVTITATPLSPRDCHIYFKRNGGIISPDEFCAWDEKGDTCTGDLGGPLIGKVSGRFYVVGLHSYALTASTLNDKAAPGVYTKVASHLKWIQTVINQTQPVEVTEAELNGDEE